MEISPGGGESGESGERGERGEIMGVSWRWLLGDRLKGEGGGVQEEGEEEGESSC